MALVYLSALHKASRQISIFLESQLRELGLAPTEGHLLTYLHDYAPAPMGEVVRVFGMKRSTLTSMIDRLEAEGLVRREVNRDDRRSFLLHISDEGRLSAERTNRLLESLEDEITQRTTERDRAGFDAVLSAVEQVTQVRVRER